MVKRLIISLRSIFKYKEKFILPLAGKLTWLDAVSISDALTNGFKCSGTAGRDTWTEFGSTRVGTLTVATIYLQLIQNRYMFRS